MSSVAEARGGSGHTAASHGAVNGGVHGAGDWLCLAAAPTFGVMALLTAVLGSGPPDILCGSEHASPLGGMVPCMG